ncbi:MAG: YdbL family protein [Pseudomonadota bacterium]|nr:YdbL family protein [Pseudomonadota bacterium]
MLSKISAWLFGATFLITACVTINVYFPAAAAEKAADRIIDDVWQTPSGEATTPPPTSSLPVRMLVAAADLVIPRAEAQQPNIDISSPEVQRVKDSMQTRFDRLKPFLDSGAVGLTGDGLIALREANAVPLAQRNVVKSLIADENADRAALYREIANANGQPQWAGQIQSVFAQRWVAKAQSSWWYEDAGGWKQK